MTADGTPTTRARGATQLATRRAGGRPLPLCLFLVRAAGSAMKQQRASGPPFAGLVPGHRRL